MNIVDVMIDLETLGTAPGSVVLSIGAVARPNWQNADGLPYPLDFLETLIRIDMRDSIFYGLSVDPDTMSWWRKQAREAWESSISAADALPLSRALETFRDWLDKLRAAGEGVTGSKLRLWGDSAAFDLVLLACAYRAAKLPVPWTYQEEYDYRTVRNLRRSEKPRSKLQHDGLSDARAQMDHLQRLLYAVEAKEEE